MSLDDRIGSLPNLGPRSEGWLNAVGIHTRRDLEKIGAVMAYKLVQQHGFAPSLNLLYAMEGAIRDVHWNALPNDVRVALRRAVED